MIEPYYHDDLAGITIYHGDCREIIPLLASVDLALTDPPYGITGGSGTLNKKRGKGKYNSTFLDDRTYIETVCVPIINALIMRIGCVVVTPGNKNFDLYPRCDSFGVFYQPAAVGLQTFGNIDAQPILYYGKNASGKNFGVPCSYQLTEPPEKFDHPCVKPLRAWRRLLNNISKPSQTVLDPFMGSGTTLRAAKDLGLKAIGIEIDERYCEIAVQRLSQEVLALDY